MFELRQQHTVPGSHGGLGAGCGSHPSGAGATGGWPLPGELLLLPGPLPSCCPVMSCCKLLLPIPAAAPSFSPPACSMDLDEAPAAAHAVAGPADQARELIKIEMKLRLIKAFNTAQVRCCVVPVGSRKFY